MVLVAIGGWIGLSALAAVGMGTFLRKARSGQPLPKSDELVKAD